LREQKGKGVSCGKQLELIAKDPFMRKRYQELKNRKGGKMAIVAIARMLIIRVRRILFDNEPYLLKAA
jgi:hypothetical protein